MLGAGRSTNVRDLRRSNRARALTAMYLQGPLTRSELGRTTGVSPATVSNLVGELVEQGVLVQAGAEESAGGRPRALLRIDPSYGYVVGVDVGETAVLVELFDLRMQVLASRSSTPSSPVLDADEVVRHVLAGLDAVVASAGVPPESILGVGVGVPGLVERGQDAVVHAQTVGWDAVPLGAMLRRGTGLPLLVDNGAKALGQAEKWYGAARDADDVVVVLLGSGVGTSIILGGELYRGPFSSAGEWGHTTVSVGGRLCRCGATGCLEAYVGAPALLARYAELRGGPAGGPPAGDVVGRVLDLVAAGDSDAAAGEVLAEVTTYLGAGLADLVNLFNPQRIVVGGWLGAALTDRLPQIRASASRHALRLPFGHVSVVPAQLGADAVALGAATLPVGQWLASGAAPVAPPAARGGRLLPARVG